LTLAAVAVLGAAGVPLTGREMIVPLVSLLAIGLALNLALIWLEHRHGPSHFWEWVARLGNLALITAGLHISGGLSSPYIPLYAVYIVTGAVRHGRRGATRCVVLATVSLLALLALGGSLILEPLALLAINVGLLVLTGVIAGSLGQQRIDAVQAAERRAEELAVLNEVGHAINARLEVDRLLEEIRRQTGQLMDVSNFYVALLDEEAGQLVFPLFYRHGQREEVPPQNHDEGFTGHVVHTREPLRLDNTPEETIGRGLKYLGYPCRSWLGVPMIVGERVLGVITVQSYDRPHVFDSGDAKILQTIAAQAAVALENARLYQETHRRAEQLRYAYEKLEALDRQRTEFVQHVSHDLRAPLTFIRVPVELMLMGEQGPLTRQQRESLESMLKNTHRLTCLAEDIITLECPQLDPKTLVPTSLPALARAALQAVEAVATAANITIRAEIPDDIPQVWADPRRLMRVFDNLLSNAIKYSPDGGTVTVSIKDVGHAIQIKVEDEGIGIPKEAQAHVFERFYRVDPSKQGRFGSMGLGLAVVKELVQVHGGQVWVESEVGRGSTFCFTVPKSARVD
jgi:signal transduction histidine kinase